MASQNGTSGQGSPRKTDVQHLWGQDQGTNSFQLPGLPSGKGKTADFSTAIKQNLSTAILAYKIQYF
jgi:hypothetical protein